MLFGRRDILKACFDPHVVSAHILESTLYQYRKLSQIYLRKLGGLHHHGNTSTDAVVTLIVVNDNVPKLTFFSYIARLGSELVDPILGNKHAAINTAVETKRTLYEFACDEILIFSDFKIFVIDSRIEDKSPQQVQVA